MTQHQERGCQTGHSLAEVAGAAGDGASARVMMQERKDVVGVRLQMGERGYGFARGTAHWKGLAKKYQQTWKALLTGGGAKGIGVGKRRACLS